MRMMNYYCHHLICLVLFLDSIHSKVNYNQDGADPYQIISTPMVINTWNFIDANVAAYSVLTNTSAPHSAIDAVEAGCSVCEVERCDGSVGWGSHPDENGETTLDAMIMDGDDFNVGAVGSLRRIKSAVSVARRVLENTHHSFLAGELATQFAVKMGFQEQDLSSDQSQSDHINWLQNNCQPNFWTNVSPDPSQNCGPYTPLGRKTVKPEFGKSGNHDTIGMIALDSNGKIAAGTSTNGAANKIPGRIGDSPIPGAGAYADSAIGGAAATGDGDVMLRFLPAFTAVEAMRSGLPPQLATQTALERIIAAYPTFSGAVVALSKDGQYGAACHNVGNDFPFSISSESIPNGQIIRVPCLDQTSGNALP